MAKGLAMSAAVVFVRALERSQTFYQQLLELEDTICEHDAVLLTAADGRHLILRERERAPGVSGALGVQFLVWTARDVDDLARCEKVLDEWGTHVATTKDADVEVLEGADPDGVTIVVTYPAVPPVDATTLPARVYAY